MFNHQPPLLSTDEVRAHPQAYSFCASVMPANRMAKRQMIPMASKLKAKQTNLYQGLSNTDDVKATVGNSDVLGLLSFPKPWACQLKVEGPNPSLAATWKQDKDQHQTNKRCEMSKLVLRKTPPFCNPSHPKWSPSPRPKPSEIVRSCSTLAAARMAAPGWGARDTAARRRAGSSSTCFEWPRQTHGETARKPC